MDRKRILKEAQGIAAKFSFWMVSGKIKHLFGYVLETPEKKYELEILFDENFPNSPPQFKYHDEIINLLGNFQLKELTNWTPESDVVYIIQELKLRIKEALDAPQVTDIEDISIIDENVEIISESKGNLPDSEEYITPDLNAYPPDVQFDTFVPTTEKHHQEMNTIFQENIDQQQDRNILLNTELALIQQEYAYDHIGSKYADLNVYITITLTKTFIIRIDFTSYPERPTISIPDDAKKIIADPYTLLDSLKKWNIKKAPHVIEVIHEIEVKLSSIKDIELELNKIQREYQYEMISNNLTKLRVHLLTYGFNEFIMELDLAPYPKPPMIVLSPELHQIINISVSDLNSIMNWREKVSEPVEIIREISWLVDKNSRISFEIELLKANYKDIKYNQSASSINIDMKGKMKTQDLTFQFQIDLPMEYPMKTPEIKVLNEFELDTHEKIKEDLQASFSNFFNEWTPFSYLVDLFNLISEKIFEVSIVSCVICHSVSCPSCSVKIAGPDSCHAECSYCERSYHKHCWEQTIKSFGKCGFCLRTPP